jgi:hypothetical protein
MVLACGAECQPTTITREIQIFPSSCRPAKVATDVADGFIKGLGNPQGPSVLISELLAAELGTWFGLKIPPFAVVDNCPIQIPMLQHNGHIQPPVFFSKAIDGAPRDPGGAFLPRLRRPSDVARLVVFDTWIRNNDRYVEGSENSDNLLYAPSDEKGRYDVVPIDHSHCFTDQEFEIDLPERLVDLTRDDRIYGRYPEFIPFITAEAVDAALGDLARLDSDFVNECVNTLPPEWGLSLGLRQPLVDLICGRAGFVIDTLRDALIDPTLPFDGPGE